MEAGTVKRKLEGALADGAALEAEGDLEMVPEL
jgi:hypothetical protein